MATEGDRLSCRNPECEIASDKGCLEGNIPPESCPQLQAGDEDDLAIYEDDASNEGVPSADAGETRIALPSGEALDEGDVDRFLRWRPATFVTIVGDRDSGKSTLVCSLYDRLIRGPFAELTFAGSRTLVALERRLHHSRIDSGRAVPDTPRTSISEGLHYLHLAVATKGAMPTRIDLLLSDRAGEIYQRARGNSDIVASLPEVPLADRLVLLLDGGRAVDPIERANAMQSVRQTLRAFLDNGALGAASIVQIVTTKIDLIAGRDDSAEVEDAIGTFQDRLSTDFGSRLRELTYWKIAARDPRGGLQPAHGLDALLADWKCPRAPPPLAKAPDLVLESEFDRLLARTSLEGSG